MCSAYLIRKLEMPGIFLKKKKEKRQRTYKEKRGRRYMVLSVKNIIVKEKCLVVMLADGFIRSGLSDTTTVIGVHDNPSLPAAFRNCLADCLQRVSAM